MTDTARIYARSLYELCRDEGLGERVADEIAGVSSLMQDSPDIIRLLGLPSLPKTERCKVADTCFAGHVHTYLLSFIKILIEHSLIAELPGCAEEYRRLYREDNGIMAVTAVTAEALADDLREKLTARLEEVFGKKIELTVKTDPNILGGIRLETEGKLLDGTLRARLESIHRRLAEAVL